MSILLLLSLRTFIHGQIAVSTILPAWFDNK